MDENTPLKVSREVEVSLKKRLEGLRDVERAFVFVRS